MKKVTIVKANTEDVCMSSKNESFQIPNQKTLMKELVKMRTLMVSLLVIFLCLNTVKAAVKVPPGSIKGVWEKDTYLLSGTYSIKEFDTLLIKPGSVILTPDGLSDITVYGSLLINDSYSAGDSVYYSVNTTRVYGNGKVLANKMISYRSSFSTYKCTNSSFISVEKSHIIPTKDTSFIASEYTDYSTVAFFNNIVDVRFGLKQVIYLEDIIKSELRCEGNKFLSSTKVLSYYIEIQSPDVFAVILQNSFKGGEAAINIGKTEKSTVEIVNNIFIANTNPLNIGISSLQSTSIVNNSFYNNLSDPSIKSDLFNSIAKGVYIVNNIIYNLKNSTTSWMNAEVVLNNIFKPYGTSEILPIIDISNITEDPQFRNLENLSLLPTSPAIDKGNKGYSLYKFDYFGNDRVMGNTIDIGATEYRPFTKFLSQKKQWSYKREYTKIFGREPFTINTDYFMVGVDTIVGSKQYQKIYKTNDSTLNNWKLVFLARENSGRIYLRALGRIADILWIDFHANAGESFYVADGYLGDSIKITIKATDSYYHSGVGLKRISFSTNFKNDAVWIQRLGTTNIQFANNTFYSKNGSLTDELECVWEEGSLYYTNDKNTNPECWSQNYAAKYSTKVEVDLFPATIQYSHELTSGATYTIIDKTNNVANPVILYKDSGMPIFYFVMGEDKLPIVTNKVLRKRFVMTDDYMVKDSVYYDTLLFIFRFPEYYSFTGKVRCADGLQNIGGSIDLTPIGFEPISYLWSNGATTQDLANVGAGKYFVTATEYHGYQFKDTFEVCFIPVQANIITPSEVHICENTSTTIQANHKNYVEKYYWSTGETTASISVSQSGVYTVLAIFNSGMSISDTVKVIVDKVEPVTIVGDALAFVSETKRYYFSPSTTSPNNIQWKVKPETFALLQVLDDKSVEILFGDTGTYTLYLSNNLNNCYVEDSLKIEVNKQYPGISISGISKPANGITNTGGSVNITVNQIHTTTETPIYTYKWSNGATTEDISNLSVGTYIVTVSNQFGEREKASFNVLFTSEPFSLINSDFIEICQGMRDSVIANKHQNIVSYNWGNGDVSNYTIVSESGVLKLKALFTSGMMAYDSIRVIVNPYQTFNIIGADMVSVNSMETYNFQPYSTEYNLSWVLTPDTAGNLIVNADKSASITFKQVGEAKLSLVVSDDEKACILGADKNITIMPIDTNTFAISGIASPANGLTNTGGAIDVSVTNLSTSTSEKSYSYKWSNGETTEDIINLAVGVYTITVTDNNNISKIANFSVGYTQEAVNLINPLQLSACSGTTIKIDAIAGQNILSYQWSNGEQTASISVTESGEYSLKVVFASGMAAYDTVAISMLPVTVLNIIGSDYLTVDKPENYTFQPYLSEYDVSWILNPTSVGTVKENDDNSATVSINTPGEFELSLQVNQNDTSCIEGTTKYLFAVPSDTSTFVIRGVVTPANGITNKGGAIDVSIENIASDFNTYTYKWSNGATSQDITNLSVGVYTVTITDNNNIEKTTEFAVGYTQEDVNLIISEQIATCENEFSIKLNAVSDTNIVFYEWSNGSFTDTIIVTDSGSYTLKAYYASGMIVLDTVSVVINSKSYLNILGAQQLIINTPETYTFKPYSKDYILYWSLNVDSVGTIVENEDNTTTITFNTSGNYELRLEVGDTDKACVQGSVMNIEVLNNDTLSFYIKGSVTPANGITNNGGAIAITIENNSSLEGEFTYLWSNGATTEDIENLSVGTYQLTVTEKSGSKTTASFKVGYTQEIVNLIQPNSFNTCDIDSIRIDAISDQNIVSYKWSNGKDTSSIYAYESGKYSLEAIYASGMSIFDSILVSMKEMQTIAIVGSESVFVSTQVTYSFEPYSSEYNLFWNLSPSNAGTIKLNDDNTALVTFDSIGDAVLTLTVKEIYEICMQSSELKIKVLPKDTNSFIVTGIVSPAHGVTNSGGAINVSVEGGNENVYTYLWSNGATTQDIENLSVGNYLVTVTDNFGKEIIKNFAVGYTQELVNLVKVDSIVLCRGERDIIEAQKSSNITSYVWSTGQTNYFIIVSEAGSYTLAAHYASGMIVTDTVLVIMNEPKALSIAGNENVFY
ncbi:MAG: hypothetical protein IPO21_08215 [Bacteroidales bacterium]|nr:hypothetical protein [Bacteroidales bacterium]